MKHVLCFGDSNTWGYIPGSEGRRYAHDVRWPGVMAAKLGEGYRVVEEGLPGRTTVWEDPCMADRCGAKQLPFLLFSHQPLDGVIVMLGTNDLKDYLHLTANDIAIGAGKLVEMIQQSDAGSIDADGGLTAPKVLLVSPTSIVPTPNPFGHKFDTAIERSRGLAAAYREIADDLGCAYFDAGSVVTCPPTDGIHLDESNHRDLGEALAKAVAGLC